MTSFGNVHAPSIQPVRKRVSEQAYVLNAHKRLRKLNVPCKWEAALLGRSIDLVFLHHTTLISVEFKLKDWRRGLAQANDHQLGVDYAFLCIPGKQYSEETQNESSEKGVGLLAFNDEGEWPFSIVLPARVSPVQWQVARERLMSLIDPS